MQKNTGIDFEKSMKELESVVVELDGEIKLDRAIALFEQGMKLSKECEEFLKGAERKIEMLKRGEDGEIITVSFPTEDECESSAGGIGESI